MHIRIQKKSLVSGTKYQSTAISLAMHMMHSYIGPHTHPVHPGNHIPILTRWQPPERTKKPRHHVGTGAAPLVSGMHGVRRSATPWP